jgi:hypothetical protein
MSDSTHTTETRQAALWLARRDHDLRARFEHLRALNSAWAVLAPFGLSDEGRHVVETGRAVASELAELAGQPFEDRDESALSKLDKLLDVIKDDILALALGVPVAEFRSTLPALLPGERRGVLDLLDLMLIAQIERHHDSAGRISGIDYLITLLTTGGADGDGSLVLDPVGLTSRLHALCERAGGDDDPRLAAIETEFYAAAEACTEQEARDEVGQRALRGRKRELGASFFAPRVLRAIVTYNTALSRCIAHGVDGSRDWGFRPVAAEELGTDASVFETEVLPRLGEALRRRLDGAAPGMNAVDRVAWCLDLESLDRDERAALLSPSVGRPEDLTGTTILVGLLCRSAVVLDGEFPAIGISPETLSSDWVRELDGALKREVNQGIALDAYKEACALSELRTRFLYSLRADKDRRPRRIERKADETNSARLAQQAREIVHQALEPQTNRRAGTELVAREGWKDWRTWPRAQLVRIGAAGAVLGLLALALAGALLPDRDLDRLSRAELDRVSPYLAQGARNGEGRGPAFVGTIDEDWSRLAADAQKQAALEMVAALRSHGAREIMVYDDERRTRIQALGQGSVRVFPAERP